MGSSPSAKHCHCSARGRRSGVGPQLHMRRSAPFKMSAAWRTVSGGVEEASAVWDEAMRDQQSLESYAAAAQQTGDATWVKSGMDWCLAQVRSPALAVGRESNGGQQAQGRTSC